MTVKGITSHVMGKTRGKYKTFVEDLPKTMSNVNTCSKLHFYSAYKPHLLLTRELKLLPYFESKWNNRGEFSSKLLRNTLRSHRSYFKHRFPLVTNQLTRRVNHRPSEERCQYRATSVNILLDGRQLYSFIDLVVDNLITRCFL